MLSSSCPACNKWSLFLVMRNSFGRRWYRLADLYFCPHCGAALTLQRRSVRAGRWVVGTVVSTLVAVTAAQWIWDVDLAVAIWTATVAGLLAATLLEKYDLAPRRYDFATDTVVDSDTQSAAAGSLTEFPND